MMIIQAYYDAYSLFDTNLSDKDLSIFSLGEDIISNSRVVRGIGAWRLWAANGRILEIK